MRKTAWLHCCSPWNWQRFLAGISSSFYVDGRTEGGKELWRDLSREVVSFRTDKGNDAKMSNVRVWEEGGRRVALGTLLGGWHFTREERWSAVIHIYIRQDRGRVSMWISDRRSVSSVWQFPVPGNGQRASVGGHRTRLLDNLVLAVRPFV
jgi:hypothetical protein